MPPRGHIPMMVFNILGGEKIQFANRSRKSTSGHRGTGWGALLAETEVMAPEGGRSHVESLAD